MLIKRSFSLTGHRTSVALEAPFWDEIEHLARRRAITLAALVAGVDTERSPPQSLASALRLLALTEAKTNSPAD